MISFQSVFFYFNVLIIFYVVVVNGFYLSLFLLSLNKIRDYMKRSLYSEYAEINSSELTPPVSILLPAYNEELTIRESLYSLLHLNYPEYEIIVVNDGSKDRTLDILIEQFQLVKASQIIRYQVPTKNVTELYRSKLYPNLIVVDKENGGKADALNAGINLSSYPYFCGIDADSVLERDALLKAMRPFIEGHDEIVACGGIIRIANGCTIRSGRVINVDLSRNVLAVHQVIEYLRSFLMGRIGMSSLSSLLIISGAFGIFRKRDVIHIGGYDPCTIGEDMELVVRLQKHMYKSKSRAKVLFVPDPVCWTEAPESLGVLRKQRTRWALGLMECLSKHRNVLFNPKYRTMGLFTMPYFLIVEILGPPIELIGLLFFGIGYALGLVNLYFAIFFLISTLVFGIFLSMTAVLLEEISFRRYTKVSQFVKLVYFSIIENFWYRQVNAFWRTFAFYKYWRNERSWTDMERKGLSRPNEPDKPTAHI
ncbi:glycosyltransferase family 2 protein [Paenibacillus tarimensis]